MYSQINKNISRYVSFEPKELEIFNSLLEHKTVPKKTILLHEGEMCDFEAFVIKGCIRKYYIDANGFEVILQFAIENAWLSDISFSIYEKKPSRVFIETLEECEFFMFTPDTKEALFAKAPKFERAFRILMQRNLAVTQERLFNTISKTATEKYLEFLELYPTLSQRVAQHYIASYVGISAEFLSKIRTKIAKH
ncbi:MAG TPA: Crp/Fnr family transcriptional regulator [Flavobacterium sp.]|uniref:Crp/Fnr family transcriptional regulator n=1 Tax=Flavobacterium sp. TaxID=239 RepID=UPI001B748686|nr:Crp/Fnr family transcriptional regulator [Flavobacterium sp.]MBP6146124.1 Crp/Fnr family transcriptional regulator [Flavobacterium sp.]MBP7182162.1 Crp/Fnr family transcriptional regulator [Flavobacterium sp.]MBP7317393.1 Crp/Fnr family transcriptional regulator [Flavobacterium sp.]MBP8885914.1 Crp/Fnr family transcriptional regulator [Flavobacterium sp.]HRL70567.1 Crp/Fnr family transcriptional regulator [Flavobacterium sp.]